MKNPWEEIPLSDYENHMKLDSVLQLQVLNTMMKQQFSHYPVKSAMVLGVAGGNGLEHIDANRFEKIYGVDINAEYLKTCAERFKRLGDSLKCLCVDLSQEDAELPQAELLIANLLIEYIGYECFQKSILKVQPTYVTCIIQINTDESFVSDSPYLHVFDDLDKVHHQMAEKELEEAMKQINYRFLEKTEQKLPNGKKLVQLDFMR